ncbi:CENP-S associating centromere protein X-domain-containing protein [Aspergillus oleicola]
MPPERQLTQKRRHLPFKPPSRASGGASASTSTTFKPAPKTKKNAKPSTTASSSKASKPISRSTKPKPAKPSSSRQRPSPSPSNSASEAESNSNSNPANSERASSPTGSASASNSDSENEASTANYILAEITHPDPDGETEDVLSSDPLIPPKLLTKLVHHHFKNEKTKIAKDANGVVAKYIDVFVREAVARAAFERGGADGEGGRTGDGFLEVEDLEKMGPQLAMDF